MPASYSATGILVVALSVRLGLFALLPPSILDTIAQRVELSTPLTSYHRLKEGVFLYQHGISPYDGGVTHQAPLLLAAFSAMDYLPRACHWLVFSLLDVACAYWLMAIVRCKAHQTLPKQRKYRLQQTLLDDWQLAVAALYLFNPYTILSCLACSTLGFVHLSILSAVGLAMQGYGVASMAWLAFASYLDYYPVMLVPAAILLLQQTRPATSSKLLFGWYAGLFLVWLLSLLVVSRVLMGSWEFLDATYGVILTVPDLTPNVGLFWYYFMEMFDHFRAFFLVVFQMNALVYALPITYRFRHHPLYIVFALCGIISVFKSYPSFGDTAFHLAFLPVFRELMPYYRYSFLVAQVYAFTGALAVAFYHIWIHVGTGNANFFYAITLVHALGQIMLLIDTVYAMLRHKFCVDYPRYRQCKVVQT
ncbi:GPI transamidase subunit PIG-U [Syncephalis pseudoplumigaleata]|uniref:GPI transamidase subunit PIG-U n=1 Tax=Syncephalis pseudoplumigaleata TaxID=1712513 RepID=A0A4P9Z696_9FUNG|nr:GPI transamidase subunit PIG-U [Syncephalis pseudoplumigaleata]|eukprot:RKP27968.1 GPI transamidase subunit PIG-U [Syncephalis pseudoplumigaleata]